MPEFSFIELSPNEGDKSLIEQTSRFLKQHVWRGQSTPEEIDFLRSYHLAIARDAAGQIAAAGSMMADLPDCYLADLATAPDYRRQHQLGTTILEMLEDKARELGAQRMRGWALSGARSFFEKRGYELINPSSDDGDMQKDLTL